MEDHSSQRRVSVQCRLPLDALELTKVLWEPSETPFDSFSQFMETLVLWIHGIYVEDAAEMLIHRLKELKARRFMSLPSMRRQPRSKAVHLSLSEHARETAEFFVESFPVLFTSRNEFFALALLYAGQYSRSQSDVRYVTKRLKNAFEKACSINCNSIEYNRTIV